MNLVNLSLKRSFNPANMFIVQKILVNIQYDI